MNINDRTAPEQSFEHQKLLSILTKLSSSIFLSESENRWLQTYQGYQSNSFVNQQQDSIYNQKKQLFASTYRSIFSYCQEIKLHDDSLIKETLWLFWLPLAIELASLQQEKKSVLVVGILGGQGTGKTTLTQILRLIWQQLNLSSIAISIDDLYKTYEERQALLKIDPRLIWRGPPATHDVELGLQTIDALINKEPTVAVPRFDKSAYQGMGDRTESEVVSPVEIVLLEGWFAGVTPVDLSKFENPPFPIVTEEDKQFAIDNNERLKEYLPLWDRFNYLLVLNPEQYRFFTIISLILVDD